MGLDEPPQNPLDRPFVRDRYEPHDYRAEISVEQARQSIIEGMPDFKVESIARIGGGLGSQAFLINGKYISRFARHEGATKTQEKEAGILPQLHKSLVTPIPDILNFGKQSGSDLTFMVYEILPGRESEKDDFISPKGELHFPAIRDLAHFFQQLHAFPLEKAQEAGVPAQDMFSHFRNQLEDARETLYPFLDEHYPKEAERIKTEIEKAFAEYLGDEKNMQFAPALIHGDLESEHIFIDPKKGRISGVIDFGGLKISDPDYDLWRPYYHFGKKVMDRMLTYYPHPDSERLYKKMDFFWKAQHIHRLVRRLLAGDQQGLARGVERLQKKLYE